MILNNNNKFEIINAIKYDPSHDSIYNGVPIAMSLDKPQVNCKHIFMLLAPIENNVQFFKIARCDNVPDDQEIWEEIVKIQNYKVPDNMLTALVRGLSTKKIAQAPKEMICRKRKLTIEPAQPKQEAMEIP